MPRRSQLWVRRGAFYTYQAICAVVKATTTKRGKKVLKYRCFQGRAFVGESICRAEQQEGGTSLPISIRK